MPEKIKQKVKRHSQDQLKQKCEDKPKELALVPVEKRIEVKILLITYKTIHDQSEAFN